MLLGFLLGPVTGVFDTGVFRRASPVISSISIILITFEAGLDLDSKTFKVIFPKTFLLTIVTFLFIMAGTSVLGPVVYPDLTFIDSMILGVILGGLSTVAVASLRNQLQLNTLDDAWDVLSLESTLVDPIRVIIAIALIKLAVIGSLQPMNIVKDMFYILIMGSATGLAVGVIWSVILHRLRTFSNHYVITLAILLQVYYIAEYFAGSGGGTIACFTFGFTISNLQMLSRWLGYSLRVDIKQLTDMNKEISFLLKSYYFVYVGLIVNIDQRLLLAGVILTLMIIVMRFISGSITGLIYDFSSEQIDVIRLTYPLGTSALVFSQLPLIYDVEGVVFNDPHLYTNIIFPVVLGTIIFSSLIGPIIFKQKIGKVQGSA
jgi:cell volume regulation protein A